MSLSPPSSVLVRHMMVMSGAALLLAACGGGASSGDGGPTDPPASATFDNLTVTPSTATLVVGQSLALTATGRSSSGTPVGGVSVSYASSNAAVASVSSSGNVVGASVGTATITVTGTLGSVTRNVGVGVTVTGSLPSAVTVVAGATTNDFTPANVVIARGGTVTWTFGGLVHNVNFQGTGAPAAIPNTSNASVSRTFNTAGTFDFFCSLHSGMNGTVQVP